MWLYKNEMTFSKTYVTLYNFYSDKLIRVFIFGDYAFLCAVYGITGANGKNIFLCLIIVNKFTD